MKYKLLLALFCSFLSVAAMAQGTGRIGEHQSITSWTVPATSFTTASQGRKIAERILDAVGLNANFEIQPANIENAAAVVYDGKRYVLYNPTFINNLIKTTGTEWAAISVLAHEIGHHLNGHTVTATGSQPSKELEADEFSGYVLRKMGATLLQSQAAMKTLAGTRASYTHPARYDRLAAIEYGWNHANDQLAGRQTVRQKPAITQAQTAPVQQDAAAINSGRPAATARAIVGDVFFHADPSNVYYVTANYNLVKVINGGVRVLGKLARLNSNRFPYVLYDAQNTQLLVDSRGNIVTRSGRPVGVLRNHAG
ncbi:MAG TPA: M48 family metalloprotease [Flavisolibacter sp.]|nr:M48 family metalloprotease [Flavisolibacter sp.]